LTTTLNIVNAPTLTGNLYNIMDDIVALAKKKCHKRSIIIGYVQTGQYSAAFTVTDPEPSNNFLTLKEWAMGKTINVPSGGFKPKRGKKALIIKKQWGEVVLRSRTYNRLGPGPRKVRGSGFLKDAIDEVLTPERLASFGKALVKVIVKRPGK
jgi:hypothetical protein